MIKETTIANTEVYEEYYVGDSWYRRVSGPFASMDEAKADRRRLLDEVDNKDHLGIDWRTVAAVDGEILPVYPVLSHFEEEADKKLKRLVRRANKLGVDAPKATKVGLKVQEKIAKDGQIIHVTEYVLYALKATPVALNGWEFIGTVQHLAAGNILRPNPRAADVEIPEHYRTVGPDCDHCQMDRRRKDTFLIRKDGEIRQVGRNCLADYVGVKDGTQLLKALKFDRDVLSSLNEWGLGGSHGPSKWGTLHFLEWAAVSISATGWLSRSKAGDFETATADHAWMLMVSDSDDAKKERRAIKEQLGDGFEEAAKTAAKALKWARNLTNQQNDYIWNLHVACSEEAITHREAGIVASAIFAYQREMERELQRRERNKGITNEFFGSPGDKIGRSLSAKDKRAGKNAHPALTGTVTMVREMHGHYGLTTLIKIKTESGHQFAWFASGSQNVKVGDAVEIVGTIKRHNDFKGLKETHLTRCNLEVLETA